jgi:uncharacterized RDD family membrane protein YckC
LQESDMTSVTEFSSPPADETKYGRFSRRLQAVLIDSIVMSLILATTLFIAVSLQSDNVGRILGFSAVAIFLLYEPILVSFVGSTVGHLATNLRVFDNRTGKNVSFPKAVIRAVIKTVLGLYSFITMAFTLRHQALHDILTGSTVQIRDPAKARPHHYSFERASAANSDMPSVARRLGIIVAYIFAGTCILVFGVYLVTLANPTAVMSAACADNDICSARDEMVINGLTATWLILIAIVIAQGLRGKLWGARPRRRTPV